MKELVLKEIHQKLGAKMLPFAGYNMPIQYSKLSEEHINVRNNVGIFDVSHMGEFFIFGNQAIELIQYITTNDVNKLIPNKIQYSCMPNGKGGIIDDLLVYCINKNKYMLVVNASNIQKDWDWIQKNNRFDAQLINCSDEYSLLAVQGPKSIKTLQKLTNINLSEISYYTFQFCEFANIPNILVSATGYTGSGGFEIYIPNKYAVTIFNKIMKAGEPYNILPIGLGARDTLRLEMGFCLYGNDIDDTTSPLEAGLSWITKFVDKNHFIDREFLAKQKEEGVKQKLIAFEIVEKGIPRKGYQIFLNSSKVIGIVTSGTISPCLNKGIGMGYVITNFSSLEQEIYIKIREKLILAKIVKLPFYKKL